MGHYLLVQELLLRASMRRRVRPVMPALTMAPLAQQLQRPVLACREALRRPSELLPTQVCSCAPNLEHLILWTFNILQILTIVEGLMCIFHI